MCGPPTPEVQSRCSAGEALARPAWRHGRPRLRAPALGSLPALRFRARHSCASRRPDSCAPAFVQSPALAPTPAHWSASRQWPSHVRKLAVCEAFQRARGTCALRYARSGTRARAVPSGMRVAGPVHAPPAPLPDARAGCRATSAGDASVTTGWGKADFPVAGIWTGRARNTINRPLHTASSRCRHAQVAQLVEHATENRSVGGSTPSLGTITLRRG